jgi:hypothetical protein
MKKSEKYELNREQALELVNEAGRSKRNGGRMMEKQIIGSSDRFEVVTEGVICRMRPGKSIENINLYCGLARFWLFKHGIKPVGEAVS